MSDQLFAVIMAGGGGTRLWPVSRQQTPKQLIQLFGEKSLFQIAVDRLEGFIPSEKIFVVTTAEQVARLRSQEAKIPARNFLIEPQPRGTAAVVAMAAAAIRKVDPTGVIAVLTADHLIENIPGFQQHLSAACDVAKLGLIATLGIKPSFPSTGYGYIESGDEIGEYYGVKGFHVRRFIEKPRVTLARELLKSDNFSWNSGMFICRVDTILAEYQKYMPDLFATITGLIPQLGEDHLESGFQKIWNSIQPQTIDYGIMEKTDLAAVLPADNLGWFDVGSWDSFFDIVEADENGNIVIQARHIGIDTMNTLVVSTKPDHLIVTLGMSDVIIVQTNDAVLICPRGESQRVKELVNYLKENQYTLFM